MQGRALAALLVAGVVVALVVASYGGLAALGLVGLSLAPGSASVGHAGTPVPPAFYGVDVRATNPEPANAAALMRATPYSVLRYPGGIVGERMDLSTGTITAYGGGTSTAAFGTAAFVQLCEAVSCRAIIQLPLEINSPATAVREVQYVEGTLGFHPAYWELGNEPAGWQCYGLPWSEWGSRCSAGSPGPWGFANETLAYAEAIRAVDPSAQFVGLGGTGQGSGENVRWIAPLETVAGQYLAAISIHSYVDGSGPPVATLQAFFDGLSSPYALPFVLAQAREAIAAACASCGTAVFVTELGSANGGGSFSQYIGTFDDAVFYAAEIAQGLAFGAANLCEFAWDIGSTGLVGSDGTTYAKYTLASTLLSRLGPNAVNASVSGPANVFAVATAGGGATELLLVNANAASSSVSLQGSGLPGTNATLYYWDGSGAPLGASISTSGTISMAGPSVALVVAQGVPNGNSTGGPPPPSLPSELLGLPLVDWLAGALVASAATVAGLAGGWWRLLAVPVAGLGVALLIVAWAVTPVYGG